MQERIDSAMPETVDLRRERVLLTGSGGVLGTALRGLLQERRCESFLVLGRSDCDLLSYDSVFKTWKEFGPTVVFHLAAWVAGVQGNLRFPGVAYYENARMNLNVVEASRLCGVRKFIAAGTAAVYSDEVPVPMREDNLWRGAPHGTEAPYAHAKRGMLAHLEAYEQQYGLKYCYMICTNLYGPNDRFDEKYGHVVPSLIARFHRARLTDAPSIVIWGDGTPKRDFLYAEDAARAFIVAAERGAGPINTASGHVVTIQHLVETLKRVSEYSGTIVWDSSKPKGQLLRGYDIGRLKSLDWIPQVELENGLQLTLRWYEENLSVARR